MSTDWLVDPHTPAQPEIVNAANSIGARLSPNEHAKLLALVDNNAS